MKKLKWILLALVWAALLAPFFLGAPAAHPATDDFTFAVYTHPTWEQTGSVLHVIKDAASYALRTWRDWQGTVTGVLSGFGVGGGTLLLVYLTAVLNMEQQTAQGLEIIEIGRAGHTAGENQPIAIIEIRLVKCHVGFDCNAVGSFHIT